MTKLNANKIKQALSETVRENLALAIRETIDSTNTFLLSQPGSCRPQACLAEQQTAGRGRQGKVWVSPPGQIYGSLLWNFKTLPSDFSTLSLAVAVMLLKSLNAYGALDLQIKWPNDLLFQAKKLAGILIEGRYGVQGYQCVIGFGINITTTHPAGIGLRDIIGTVDRNKIAGTVLNELVLSLPVFEQQGWAGFKTIFEAHDFLAHKEVIAGQVAGQVLGITSAGELALKQESGEVKRFRCGEVSVIEKKE